MSDAALDYAARGFAVLPLEPEGKKPLGTLVRHGLKDATTDAAKLRAWWQSAPDANVGVRTGDGLAVLDVDPRHGGDLRLAAYLKNLGVALPPTPEVNTGGGGRHYYFAAQTGQKSGDVGEKGGGLELKAEGRYVVAPPSVHASGKLYTWHPSLTLGDVPLAQVPEWLARSAPAPGPRDVTEPDEWAALTCHGVAEGQRNQTTAKLAGRLLARGLGAVETFGLLEAWDAQRNRPPLGPDEIEKVVASIAERELRKAQRKAAA